MSQLLYEKYGGFDVFSAIVFKFYQKILESERIKPYFEDVHLGFLVEHQTNFICKALGGPDRYEGRDLKEIHASLNISVEEFDEVLSLLRLSLIEKEVAEDDIALIVNLISSVQGEIVTSSSQTHL